MLKAGIYLDMENLMRNGGWGIQYPVIRAYVEAQGVAIVRANAYMAIDYMREAADQERRTKAETYRNAIRRNGFHLTLKPVMRYRNEEGEEVTKANADLDLAVDVLQQAENLDYILLGTGDGDFVRVVRSLQARGRRVDVLSFAHTSSELKDAADSYVCGALIPGLLQDLKSPCGVFQYVNEEKGYGFLLSRTGLGPTEFQDNVFCHIRDFKRDGRSVTNEEFAKLRVNQTVVQFTYAPKDPQMSEGQVKAVNATELRWRGEPVQA